jgi:membrane-associated phospholipid phosphatase
MNPAFARIISFLGHPLLVLTYALLLCIAVNPFAFGARSLSDTRAVLLLVSVFSTTFLIPGFGVALMKPLGLIRSLEMHDKQERIGPYIITGVFYLWLFKNLVSGGQAPSLYTECVLGAAIGLFFAFFANIFTKISAHATGMGGLVAMTWLVAREWAGYSLSLGALALSLNAVLALAAVVAGLVGTARLALGAHTPTDLWRGYAAGAAAVLLASVLV